MANKQLNKDQEEGHKCGDHLPVDGNLSPEQHQHLKWEKEREHGQRETRQVWCYESQGKSVLEGESGQLSETSVSGSEMRS